MLPSLLSRPPSAGGCRENGVARGRADEPGLGAVCSLGQLTFHCMAAPHGEAGKCGLARCSAERLFVEPPVSCCHTYVLTAPLGQAYQTSPAHVDPQVLGTLGESMWGCWL